MHAKVIVSPVYRHPDQIDKWADSHNFQQPVLCLDSQDLEPISDYFGNRCKLGAITGALVIAEDGDYAHVWVTWDSRPYSIYADYQHVRLYLH